MSAVPEMVSQPLRIDLGAGKNPRAGFIGVDRIDFGNGNVVCDLAKGNWPWDTSSVDEAHSAHFLEHLTNFEGRWERVTFFNELHRVLKPGAKCQLIIPHWASNRYYGDPTHKEPFSEMGFYYLDRNWRLSQAPHTDAEFNENGYRCDFNCTWGYNLHGALHVRNAEYQQHAMLFWKEACQDIVASMECRK